MTKPLRVGIAGVGRMGATHALHLQELASETGTCTLAAISDVSIEKAHLIAEQLQFGGPVFSSVEELATAGVCDAAVVVTPTEKHREHATALISRGLRVLVEKPLTGTLEGDREFAGELEREHPHALMLAFQRRFDTPIQYAKELVESGSIGRIFKIYSALEDTNPAPDGYQSGGILPDMSVHNVDEILWLTKAVPRSALAMGSRLYSHRLTTCKEDFDDALLLIWFEGELMAQVQVSRNHVSGHRVETIIFGEKGHIHVGRFEGKPSEVVVEAYGKRSSTDPIAYRTFRMRDYGRPVVESLERFGHAYKAELASFIDCCRSGKPFPTSHQDGLRAQEIISAGMQAVITEKQAAPVGNKIKNAALTQAE